MARGLTGNPCENPTVSIYFGESAVRSYGKVASIVDLEKRSASLGKSLRGLTGNPCENPTVSIYFGEIAVRSYGKVAFAGISRKTSQRFPQTELRNRRVFTGIRHLFWGNCCEVQAILTAAV